MKYLHKLISQIEYSSIIAREGIKPLADTKIKSVVCDSRLAGFDSLFVCIDGSRVDGHAFARSVYDRGCRVFVCEKEISLPSDAVIINVRDTRAALASLSAELYSHPERKLKIIGITGTKGKTSCALMLHAILCASGVKAAYVGTNGITFLSRRYETKNTTPDSTELYKYLHEMVAAGVTHVVMEISSQAIYMKRILGLSFEALAYTNLYFDHVGEGEHPSFEHYRDTKRALFCDFEAQSIVYNIDDPYAEYMTSGARSRLVSYSANGNEKAVAVARDIRFFAEDGKLCTSFDIRLADESATITLGTVGDFSVSNALCAITLSGELGVDLHLCATALEGVQIKGRAQQLVTPTGVSVIIDYAHNGASLESILLALRKYSPKHIICVFGSVGGRTQSRRAELAHASGKYADYSIITSDNPDTEAPESVISDIVSEIQKHTDAHESEPDRRVAIHKALSMARDGDVVLLAGKGHETYQLVDGKRVPFSEERIVKEYFETADIL